MPVTYKLPQYTQPTMGGATTAPKPPARPPPQIGGDHRLDPPRRVRGGELSLTVSPWGLGPWFASRGMSHVTWFALSFVRANTLFHGPWI